MSKDHEAIIMFKPDAHDITFTDLRRERLLHEVASGILVASGLTIVKYSRKLLSDSEVRTIYANALAPDPIDDEKWGTEWKDEVVEHLSSGPADSYLLTSPEPNGLEVVRSVKNWLRSHYGRQDNVVQNIAHVPDQDEIEITREVLFSHE